MVITRRASLLERQRSESEALGEEPKVEVVIEDEVTPQSVDRDSPSLLRPTPQLEVPEVKPNVVQVDDDDVVQAFSAITIKDEPVDLNETIIQPPLTSTSTTFSFELASPGLVNSGSTESDSDDDDDDDEVKSESTESSESDSEIEDRVKGESSESDSEDEDEDEDEDEEEARDTVGALRDLVRPSARGGGRTSRSGSVVSVEDAKQSIDDFMTDRQTYTANVENKLRFWQSLCIEFRLTRIQLDPLPSGYRDSVTPNQARGMRRKQKKKSDKNNALAPVPTSCTAAKNLLKDKVHVNLVDYFAARQVPLAEGEERDYTNLLFPSREAVVTYTRKHKKYIPRGDAKGEWLQPLLKTMRKNART